MLLVISSVFSFLFLCVLNLLSTCISTSSAYLWWRYMLLLVFITTGWPSRTSCLLTNSSFAVIRSLLIGGWLRTRNIETIWILELLQCLELTCSTVLLEFSFASLLVTSLAGRFVIQVGQVCQPTVISLLLRINHALRILLARLSLPWKFLLILRRTSIILIVFLIPKNPSFSCFWIIDFICFALTFFVVRNNYSLDLLIASFIILVLLVCLGLLFVLLGFVFLQEFRKILPKAC